MPAVGAKATKSGDTTRAELGHPNRRPSARSHKPASSSTGTTRPVAIPTAATTVRDSLCRRPIGHREIGIAQPFLNLLAEHTRVRSGGGSGLVLGCGPPRGFDPNHRFIEDIKRKDFVVSVGLTEAQVCRLCTRGIETRSFYRES
jgi:hypothetical protein